MSNLSRMGVLAFFLASVACGGTAETDTSTEPLGSESAAIANDHACPHQAPLPGTGCTTDHLTCFYRTKPCPHGSLTEFSCQTNGTNLAWTDARCTAKP
jgi:hypothetical protein